MHRAVVVGVLVLFACGRSQSASSDAGPDAAPQPQPPSWIAITVVEPGASAAQAEQVAEAIEHATASVGAIEHVYGELDDARSTTWVAIASDDPFEPANAIREALGAARSSLPTEALPPMLTIRRRTVVDRWLTIRAPRRSAGELDALVDRVRERWMREPGVRDVWACAPQPRTVVQLDADRLGAFGVEPRAVVELVFAGREPLSRTALPPDAIDPAKLVERVAGGPALAAMIEVRDETTRRCIARTTDGEAAVLRVDLEREALAELATRLETTRAELPPDVIVEIEPTVDGEPVRIAIDAADPAALETIDWSGQPGTLVVDRDRGRAVWIGFADRVAADAAIAGLAGRPGLLATIVPRDPVAIAVAGLDAQRLSSIAPRLAEQVAAATGQASPSLVPARTPVTALVPDRRRAAVLGITVKEIADTALLWSSDGLELGLRASDQRVVVVRIGDGRDPHWFERATVTGRDGATFPLSSVARLEQSPAIGYARCERMRCVGVVVDAATAARVDLGALGNTLALEQGETALRIPLPPR